MNHEDDTAEVRRPVSQDSSAPEAYDDQVASQAQPEPGPMQPDTQPEHVTTNYGAKRGNRRRLVALSVLIVLGLAAIGGGGAALAQELTRHATGAEASAAGKQELASRWQRLSAGRIFPRTVSYQSTLGWGTTASLVGIAPAASCAAAFDPPVARALARAGCVTALRATYVDTSGTVFATVGIAVVRSPAAAQSANATIAAGNQGGVRVVSFAGSVASQFTDAARATTGQTLAGDTYLVFYAAGYGDGRHTTADISTGEASPTALATGLMNALISTFSLLGAPCELKDIRC